jgi:hypothetical protein
MTTFKNGLPIINDNTDMPCSLLSNIKQGFLNKTETIVSIKA